MGCVKGDMRGKGVSAEVTYDSPNWKKRKCGADPTYWVMDKKTMLIYTNRRKKCT